MYHIKRFSKQRAVELGGRVNLQIDIFGFGTCKNLIDMLILKYWNVIILMKTNLLVVFAFLLYTLSAQTPLDFLTAAQTGPSPLVQVSGLVSQLGQINPNIGGIDQAGFVANALSGATPNPFAVPRENYVRGNQNVVVASSANGIVGEGNIAVASLGSNVVGSQNINAFSTLGNTIGDGNVQDRSILTDIFGNSNLAQDAFRTGIIGTGNAALTTDNTLIVGTSNGVTDSTGSIIVGQGNLIDDSNFDHVFGNGNQFGNTAELTTRITQAGMDGGLGTITGVLNIIAPPPPPPPPAGGGGGGGGGRVD